jgi:effector-binding domain-containing protein
VEYEVSPVTVEPHVLAAIPVHVQIPEIASVFPTLDRVWELVRREGLDFGHNVFVYEVESGMAHLAQVGVQVAAPFESADGIVCTTSPAGQAATTVHMGAYDRLGEAHDAVAAWCTANGRHPAGTSWEVYGDWDDDPAKVRTDIFWLLS